MSEHANEVEHADDDLEPPGGILESVQPPCSLL